MTSPRRWIAACLAAVIAAGSAAYAQQIWVGGPRGGFGGRGEPARWAKPADFDGQFNFCRGFYDSDRRENGGQGWRTDYPGADNNFSVRIAELTFLRVMTRADGQPNHVVVRLDDPTLFKCPMLFMEDVGTARLSDDEVRGLRAYLLKGGFLYVDDFWGTEAWEQWADEIARVLPPGQFPIFDIPLDHAIMHALYDVKGIEQVSSIQYWNDHGGSVSEREMWNDSPHSDFRGIADDRGRLMVVMTHNTDISDTWEREGENRQYFDRFSPDGYAIGVNIVLYGLTH